MNLQEYTEIMEQFVDSHGLDVVIATLGVICLDKGAHIQSSYSDDMLAGDWFKVADYLADKVAHSKTVQNVSESNQSIPFL